jgi:hypothetical protein
MLVQGWIRTNASSLLPVNNYALMSKLVYNSKVLRCFTAFLMPNKRKNTTPLLCHLGF